ncbi:unnamed protein product [Colias eurytheme]|nr:unnamed protein product [Colias eurytheme]
MMRPPVSSKTASNERTKRILALVPARDAGSDASDGSSSDDECKTPQSSPAPSLDASFERLNICESSDHTDFTDNEIDREIESSVLVQDQFQAPLTPVLDEDVFPSPSQCNYEAWEFPRIRAWEPYDRID